jgi:hypothetical protein
MVRRISPSKEQRNRRLLTLEMGDRKPSEFLRHLRSLGPDVPGDFLRSKFSSRLPSNSRAVFTGQPEGDLNTAARCADLIIEAETQPTLASFEPLADSNAFLQLIENLSYQVAALSAELVQLRYSSRNPRSSNSNRRSGSRSPPEMTLHPPSAGTIAATESGHRRVLSPDPTK